MPSPDQTERFRRDLEALAGAPPGRLGLAVSGGPDSLALLLLAQAAFPGRVEAATVDHRLRPENADEAAFVAALCERLAVPHETLADAPPSGASLQAQARALRYRLLAGWAGARGLPALATAHHLDDQAETVLMRLARGSGLAGLAAVRPRRDEDGLAILRPLLAWRRDELAAIVADAGLEPVDDPSNRSDAHDRTRFRALLSREELLTAPRLAAAAAHLAEAEEALAWAAEREWAARAEVEEGTVSLDMDGLPPELLHRLAARAIDQLRGDGDWRRDKLADALERAALGGRVTLAGVQISAGARWRFEPEPPRRAV
jgi:tRNA(Ile)-lysidine synthase